MRVHTVGHLPPPFTGENLCRAQFEDALISAGCSVIRSARNFRSKSWLCGCDWVLIVNGASVGASLFDMTFALAQIIRGKFVTFYFHNRSWERFRWFGFLLPMAWRRLVSALALTEEIAGALTSWGIPCRVLNNTAGQAFERQAVLLPAVRSKRLLWMGRANSHKGFDTALEAFRILKSCDSDWTFDVYGEVDLQFREVEVEGVNKHGFVSDKRKMEAFQGGGIFVLPSRYREETQPLSIIEALAAGIPVVASDVGGIRKMLAANNGVSPGEVVRDGSPHDYVGSVLRCLEAYEDKSMAARERYRDFFSCERFRKEVMNLVLRCFKWVEHGGEQYGGERP